MFAGLTGCQRAVATWLRMFGASGDCQSALGLWACEVARLPHFVAVHMLSLTLAALVLERAVATVWARQYEKWPRKKSLILVVLFQV